MVIVMSVVSFVRRVQNPILSVPCFFEGASVVEDILNFLFQGCVQKVACRSDRKKINW